MMIEANEMATMKLVETIKKLEEALEEIKGCANAVLSASEKSMQTDMNRLRKVIWKYK